MVLVNNEYYSIVKNNINCLAQVTELGKNVLFVTNLTSGDTYGAVHTVTFK